MLYFDFMMPVHLIAFIFKKGLVLPYLSTEREIDIFARTK